MEKIPEKRILRQIIERQEKKFERAKNGGNENAKKSGRQKSKRAVVIRARPNEKSQRKKQA